MSTLATLCATSALSRVEVVGIVSAGIDDIQRVQRQRGRRQVVVARPGLQLGDLEIAVARLLLNEDEAFDRERIARACVGGKPVVRLAIRYPDRQVVRYGAEIQVRLAVVVGKHILSVAVLEDIGVVVVEAGDDSRRRSRP